MQAKKIADILGVSRTSIYNWIKLYRTYGKNAFNPKPKRPHSFKKIPKEMMEKILDLRAGQ